MKMVDFKVGEWGQEISVICRPEMIEGRLVFSYGPFVSIHMISKSETGTLLFRKVYEI
jgi:hypothetical protein